MPHIPRAVCFNVLAHENNLGREMRPHKNDFRLEMLHSDDSGYYKISTDLYECPECGQQTIIGFAGSPLVEHWEEGYKESHVDGAARFR